MADESTRATTTVAYDGEALRDGTMDVRDLAPALLGLGELLDAANRRLNGDRADVKVLVRADLRHGSFEFAIDVVQLLKDAKTLLDSQGNAVQSAESLLGLLGMAWIGSKKARDGLIRFLKWLGNRKPERTEPLDNGMTRVSIGTTSIEVRNEVIVLADDPRIRAALAKTLEPLAKPGVDVFEVRRNGQALEAVRKDEVPAVVAPPTPPDPSVLFDGEHVGVFAIIKPSLIPDHRWTLSDGGRKSYGVDMEDRRFMERVSRREYMFGAGDALKVRMRTTVKRGDDGKVTTSYKVVEVLEYLPANRPAQSALFPQPPGDGGTRH